MKLFISHASEDKSDFVEPLGEALRKQHEVSYDQFALKMGDSLLKKIGDGLREYDFGVIVLSKSFFANQWPQNELDGLLALETAEKKLILPIWKDVSEEDVKQASPVLAQRFAAQATGGIPHVVDMITQAITAAGRVASFNPLESLKQRLTSKADALQSNLNTKRLLRSVSGCVLLKKSVMESWRVLQNLLENLELQTGVKLVSRTISHASYNFRAEVIGPYNLHLTLIFTGYSDSPINSKLEIFVTVGAYTTDSDRNGKLKKQDHFNPLINSKEEVVWASANESFTYDEIAIKSLEMLLDVIEGV